MGSSTHEVEHQGNCFVNGPHMVVGYPKLPFNQHGEYILVNRYFFSYSELYSLNFSGLLQS
jgi:hypothetical protein